MRGSVGRLVALVAAGGLLAGCGGALDPEGAAVATGPFTIGAVLDVTGPGASIGVPERDALLMLSEQLNAAGGINGQPVELIIEDNGSTEEGGVRTLKKLIEQDQVDVVIGASRTGPSLAMRPVAEQAEMPMISMASSLSVINGSPWVFKTAQSDSAVIENIIRDAAAEGHQELALLRDQSGFGEGVREQFEQLGSPYGIEITAFESFPTDSSPTTSFAGQLAAVQAADPDAVVIWGIAPAAAFVQKAYAAMNLGKPVYQSHGIANDVFLTTAAETANGMTAPMGRIAVASQLPDNDPQKDVINRFIEDYRARYGTNPSTFAGHAFDAWLLAVDALRTVGADNHAIRQHLETVNDFVGISGTFSMSYYDHTGLDADDLVLVTVTDQAFELVGNRN